MGKQLKLLILEDSQDDAILLVHELKRAGFDPVCRVVDSPEGLQLALADEEWEAVTSDYNMPSFNAMAALRLIQESGRDLPFIVVSGKIGEDQAVAAMKAGASDYVMKDNLSRLGPAIERELREAEDRRKRRQAEVALRNQFAQISTIFDSMNAIIYVADLQTYELLFMNRHACGIFGDDWQGRKCYEVLHGGRPVPCSYCATPRLIVDGQPQPPVISEFLSETTGKWYQCLDRVIEWPDGRLVRMEIAIDISERKEIERLKDEMISAVSHEMRTPLTAMIGFTEFLMENEVEPAQLHSYLATIHKESERLNTLIGNFLDLQKTKQRHDTYQFSPVLPLVLLHDAIDLFAAGQERHNLAVSCPASLPAIRGDEGKLHQVMTNLISNACKYSPAGTTIDAGARQAGDEIVIWVKDQGIGVPVELREKIFEKFYRVDNSDRRRVGGTGLGLALVKEIVAAHGGRVWVEGNDGEGSTFYVALPLFGGSRPAETYGTVESMR
jgi:two-component system, OmpR family, phosphate regulon sensor histidine kinase PhoR